jgi:hypothetical protein
MDDIVMTFVALVWRATQLETTWLCIYNNLHFCCVVFYVELLQVKKVNNVRFGENVVF